MQAQEASALHTEKCMFMGKELRETSASRWTHQEAGFTQFLTHKSALLSIHTSSHALIRKPLLSAKAVFLRPQSQGRPVHLSFHVEVPRSPDSVAK